MPPSTHSAAPRTRQRAEIVVGLLISLIAGSMISVQSRFNSDLGIAMGDAMGASLVSFGGGLILLLMGAVILPSGRRGMMRLPRLVRERKVPWWYLLAGIGGAGLVTAQTFTTPVLGVSVFVLSLVVGQSLGGLLVDALGLGPAGRKRLTGFRLVGALIIIAAVFTAMLPKFDMGTNGNYSLLALVGLAAIPVAAGVMSAIQTGWNGGITAQIGTPLTATTVNFTAGMIALIVATFVLRFIRGPIEWQFPPQWWLYTGGLAGIVFVAAAAVLARVLGILQTNLGLITGTLLSALLLDALFPTPTTIVTPVTVIGTLCTLVGMVVATLPWRRGLETLQAGARR